MGHNTLVSCSKCKHKFEISEGGGFLFHLLHCEKCEQSKSINSQEIGEAISENEYHKLIEKLAGKCKCGGNFLFNGKSHCPKCGSNEYKKIGIICFYD